MPCERDAGSSTTQYPTGDNDNGMDQGPSSVPLRLIT